MSCCDRRSSSAPLSSCWSRSARCRTFAESRCRRRRCVGLYGSSLIRQTGLKGVAGNKGAVAIRLDFDDSSFCFVTAHFAAGTSAVAERCHDYNTISEDLRFQRGKLIASHENVIWLGDFNFRRVRDSIGSN